MAVFPDEPLALSSTCRNHKVRWRLVEFST